MKHSEATLTIAAVTPDPADQGDREFWLERLSSRLNRAGFPETLGIAGRQSEKFEFRLGTDTCSALFAMSGSSDHRLLVVLLAAVAGLLERYSGCDAVVMGTGASHITDPGARRQGSLPVAMDIKADDTFRDLITRARDQYRAAIEHQSYPVELLIEQLREGGILTSASAFQSFVFLDAIHGEASGDGSAIAWLFRKSGNSLSGEIQLPSQFYDTLLAEQLARHFEFLLRGLLNSPESTLEKAAACVTCETDERVATINSSNTDYPRGSQIQQVFEGIVQQFPSKTALLDRGRVITYQLLNEQADKLAAYFAQQYKIGTGDRVALLVERSAEAITSMLAILKCGAAYVPIDTRSPQARREKILRRIHAQLLVTDSAHMLEIGGHEAAVFVSDLQIDSLPDAPGGKVTSSGNAESLAYIMFTSGTSGEPRGVKVPHRGVVRLVRGQSYIHLGTDERVLLTGSLSFDASTFEIWGMLLNGGTLILESQDTILDTERLADKLKERGATLLWSSTAWLNQLIDQKIALFGTLRQVVFGGEIVSPRHIGRLLERHPSLRVVHAYGPTENTTFSTCHTVSDSETLGNTICVGRPIANSTVYVVDKNLTSLPAWGWGEIIVGGDGLALGYWEDEEETRRKFTLVKGPNGSRQRVYRTGDIGQLLPNGSIVFRGRADTQVKIRGFRVEPREVEQLLLDQPGIREARVIARGSEREHYLCAYLVAELGLDVRTLRDRLKRLVPDYMLPRYLVTLDSLPLNVNGKLDVARLPDEVAASEALPEAPQSATERYLRQAWAEIIGIDEQQVGRNSDFFDLGGHSLKATLLIARVHQERGAVLTLNDIFQHSTLQALAGQIDHAAESTYIPLTVAEPRATYRCSSQQRRMFTLQALHPHSTTYNIPLVFEWTGLLDLDRLRSALTQMSARHESLRTSFSSTGDEILQTVHEAASIPVTVVADDQSTGSAFLKRIVSAFDLNRAPLLRVFVFQRTQGPQILAIDAHHIVFDAVSLDVFLTELGALYEGRDLPQAQFQYRDYAEWQQGAQWEAAVAASRQYWAEQFASRPPALNLPTTESRPALRSFQGNTLRFVVERSTMEALKRLSRDNGATLFMTLMTCVWVWLNKITGQDDLVAGTPVAGRTQPEVERIIGLFVNTLALRCRIRPDDTWISLLRETKRLALSAFEHQSYPFETLVEEFVEGRDPSRNPIFDVMFALQNVDGMRLDVKDASISPVIHDSDTAKFDINIWCQESDGVLYGAFEYNTSIFSDQRGQQMADNLQQAIASLALSPAQRVADVSVLTQKQISRLRELGSNPTPTDLSCGLHHRVQAHALATPSKPALMEDGCSVTYAELNARANQIAAVLIQRGCGPGDIVALALPRSAALVTAMIAVHKAQGAFLVVDPSLPEERGQSMVEDSSARLVLCESECRFGHAGSTLNVSDPLIDQQSDQDMHRAFEKGHAAYVIFTSGSTGRPKGVVVSHGSLANFIQGINYFCKGTIGPDDRFMSVVNTSFDVSVSEVAIALWFGGSLTIVPTDSVMEADRVASIITDHQITFAYLPLVSLNRVSSSLSRLQRPVVLSKLFIGAESINDAHLVPWRALRPHLIVVNGYGPSETTICSTFYECSDHVISGQNLPIGKPVPQTELLILDERLRRVPEGSIGELYIGGAGVAQGYTSQELTQERFCLLDADPTHRFYRTGDLVRWDGNGYLQFLGRKDSQLKIRGVRLEPGEIEALLCRHERISAAVVQLGHRDGGAEPLLVAYYVAEVKIPDNELRSWCRQRVPSYLMPDIFFHLPDPPLTQTGKINRKKLPAPTLEVSESLVEPRSAIERQLREFWSRVLRLDRGLIGVRSNFFEIGGNSLRLIELVGLIRSTLNRQIKAVDLFALPTIEDIAARLGDTASTASERVEDFSL